jgi:uncharacterized surface protein with fasciclin (FAS1) repeats
MMSKGRKRRLPVQTFCGDADKRQRFNPFAGTRGKKRLNRPICPASDARRRSNPSTSTKEQMIMKAITHSLASITLAMAATSAFAADIVDTAASAGQFNTLVKAVQAAGLVDTLKGKGPFTVFAPTDAAFAKLPAGTLESLLKDKQKLSQVLTYHVVPGKVTAAQVKTGQVKTVQGQPLSLKADQGGVSVNDAKVVKADVMADNGVIHVIDTVVLPK